MAASRSLSIAAYRALVSRGPVSPRPTYRARPSGELVWVHLGTAEDANNVLSLVDRLLSQIPGLYVLATTSPNSGVIWRDLPDPERCFVAQAPDEHNSAVAAFLDHWRPDVALWYWGRLRPCLVDEAAKRNIPMCLIAAAAEGFDGRRDRWVPEVSRSLLQEFDHISAESEPAVARLIALGLRREDVKVTSGLKAAGRLLDYSPDDLDELTTTLSSRPVWFAANAAPSEWASILTAHRQVLRGAHRALLVINIDDPSQTAELTKALNDANLSHKCWSDGEWPEPSTQVLISDDSADLGIWFRVAVLSFLGNSLAMDCTGTDPLAAAALGTVIVYGPHVRDHLTSYSRLATAGAARVVYNADALGQAVAELTQPDKAATMAHAGWSVISEGAEIIDQIVDLVQDTLDTAARQAAQ